MQQFARSVARDVAINLTWPIYGNVSSPDPPTLAAGEFFLIDDSGKYLADENDALLTGTNT